MIRASLPWVMAKSTRKPAMAQDQLHMAKELQKKKKDDSGSQAWEMHCATMETRRGNAGA
jgi:hypothetical protein